VGRLAIRLSPQAGKSLVIPAGEGYGKSRCGILNFLEEVEMMKGGLAGLMKQAQQMQNNMKKAQDELANIEVEGQSGGGMVKVTMTCAHELRRVNLDPGVLDDKEMLEDLIVAAFSDAGKKIAETTSQRMSGFAAKLPPGMSLPF